MEWPEALRPCFICGDTGPCTHREPEIIAIELDRLERLASVLAEIDRLAPPVRKPPGREGQRGRDAAQGLNARA